jgi:hypothetical protein
MRELLSNKKLIGFYILWLTLHFVLFILSLNNPKHYFGTIPQKKFWPFSKLSFSYSYDYTELLIYAIVPAAIVIALKLISTSNKTEN